jgi:transposase
MFKLYQQNQDQLLPSSLNEAVKSDHIARLIDHVVNKMDLSFLENQYSKNGQRAYPPSMLLKILIYGYSLGVRSSRKLAVKLEEDVVFMWLSGRLTPDFRTISDFRKEKLSDFKKIFENVLDQCFSLGLASVGKVSIDGTSIRASANKNRVVYRKILAKNREAIREKIEAIIEEAEVIDREEEKLYGKKGEHSTGIDFTDPKILKQLDKMKKKKESLKKKESVLKAREVDIRIKQRKMRKDRNSFASADKDATVMMMKEGYPAPGYNAQLATERQIILSYGVFQNRNDSKLIKPMVEKIKETTRRKPNTIIADAGYGNKRSYRYLKKEKIIAFLPYGSYNRDRILRNKGLSVMPTNPDVELERYKAIQRMRLQSEEGKQMLKRRREDIEPTFGNIKRNLDFRRFLLRGLKKCELEFGLVSLAHNLKKIKKKVENLCQFDPGLEKARELGQILGYLPV